MPTYVLSKVKRTGVGQKVGDLVDQEAPSTELTTLHADDRVPVQDVSGSDDPWRWFKFSRLTTYLNDVIAPAWSRVTGKPSTFVPSSHTHSASAIVSGTVDVNRIPDFPANKTTSGTFDRGRLASGVPATERDKYFVSADGTYRRPFDPSDLTHGGERGPFNFSYGFYSVVVTTDEKPDIDWELSSSSSIALLIPLVAGGWRVNNTLGGGLSGTFSPVSGDARGVYVFGSSAALTTTTAVES